MKEFIAATPDQLGQLMRGYRKAAELTQSSMAESSGLLQKTISTLETDPSQTRIDTLYKALSALNLEMVLRPRPDATDNEALHTSQQDNEW